MILINISNNPSNEYEVLPSNIGLSDNGLTTQIDRYNELIIERKRLLRTSTESNPMIVNLDTSIRAVKANVKAAIDGTLQGLLIVKLIWIVIQSFFPSYQ